MLVSFVALFICRPESALLMVPAVVAFFWSTKRNRPALAFVATYIIIITIFFASAFFLPNGGLPALVADKQHQFLRLHGTRLPLDSLSGDILSYMEVLPQAFQNTFLRPFVWEANGLLQLLASFEIIMFWALLALLFFFRDTGWKKRISHPVIMFLLCYAVSVIVSIGYLVPFPGAIIRYKAGAEIIILCGMATLATDPRIKKMNI